MCAVRITYDPNKRSRALRERGLDFTDAAEVFAGPTPVRKTPGSNMARPATFRPGCSGGGWWCLSGHRAATRGT